MIIPKSKKEITEILMEASKDSMTKILYEDAMRLAKGFYSEYSKIVSERDKYRGRLDKIYDMTEGDEDLSKIHYLASR